MGVFGPRNLVFQKMGIRGLSGVGGIAGKMLIFGRFPWVEEVVRAQFCYLLESPTRKVLGHRPNLQQQVDPIVGDPVQQDNDKI